MGFPNCLPDDQPLPVDLGKKAVTIPLAVADDLPAAMPRVKDACLRLLLDNFSIADEIEVLLNGKVLACDNPLQPGGFATVPPFFRYSLMESPPHHGVNEVTVRLAKRNERLADEMTVVLNHVEMWIRYKYPNGPWIRPDMPEV
jgi:hypothetical protein